MIAMCLTIMFGDKLVQVRRDGVHVKSMPVAEFWRRGGDTLVCSRDQARRIFTALLED